MSDLIAMDIKMFLSCWIFWRNTNVGHLNVFVGQFHVRCIHRARRGRGLQDL